MRVLPLFGALLLSALFVAPVQAARDRDGQRSHERQERHDRGPDPDRLEQKHERLVQEIREHLGTIDALLSSADNPAVQGTIRDHLDQLSRATDRLSDLNHRLAELARQPQVVVEQPAPPPQVVVVQPPPEVVEPPPLMPMSPDAFHSMVRAIQGEAFDNQKMAMLHDAGRDQWFEVQQVRRVMSLFSFGGEKVEAAAWMHSRTLDLDRWYEVYQDLTFDSEKDALRKAVSGH